ncbi:hypothetical protein NCCP1664_25160 [Zafaria cholistanensis]|uniref:Uncharacterized protein n=1 Tax=Zafaria cholistanensis TaxID=1682741 RepID=A0A5A7NVD6_9MICC|nr:hypothetical protein [Zafaria cholistanensis]GER24021.1 hypothetical protein NCCP1664_25160 [Zafaria cholistanensis]
MREHIKDWKRLGLGARLAAAAFLTGVLARLRRDQRGDVPGWVMITLMSAVLVAALLAVAGPRLEALFDQAITRVAGLG